MVCTPTMSQRQAQLPIQATAIPVFRSKRHNMAFKCAIKCIWRKNKAVSMDILLKIESYLLIDLNVTPYYWKDTTDNIENVIGEDLLDAVQDNDFARFKYCMQYNSKYTLYIWKHNPVYFNDTHFRICNISGSSKLIYYINQLGRLSMMQYLTDMNDSIAWTTEQDMFAYTNNTWYYLGLRYRHTYMVTYLLRKHNDLTDDNLDFAIYCACAVDDVELLDQLVVLCESKEKYESAYWFRDGFTKAINKGKSNVIEYFDVRQFRPYDYDWVNSSPIDNIPMIAKYTGNRNL